MVKFLASNRLDGPRAEVYLQDTRTTLFSSMVRIRVHVGPLVLLAAVAGCRAPDSRSGAEAAVRLVPVVLADTAWMQTRRDEQLKTRDQFRVFHDFRFTDRIVESGISFRNRVVSDAGKT
ncbi:MAG TPA: hypothetical protein VEX15_18655, partial [Nocardioidaceae bacterium]|nr:hypothetical protein [Nocardioidaceae bacterium]